MKKANEALRQALLNALDACYVASQKAIKYRQKTAEEKGFQKEEVKEMLTLLNALASPNKDILDALERLDKQA